MRILTVFLFVSLFCIIKTYSQTPPVFPDKIFLSERVNIEGVASGEIGRELLMNSKGLSLSNKSSTYHVSSFRMILVVKGETTPMEFFNEVNGELTPSMLDAIKNAPTGSKVYFEYIKCSLPNNTTRTIHPAEFILK